LQLILKAYKDYCVKSVECAVWSAAAESLKSVAIW